MKKFSLITASLMVVASTAFADVPVTQMGWVKVNSAFHYVYIPPEGEDDPEGGLTFMRFNCEKGLIKAFFWIPDQLTDAQYSRIKRPTLEFVIGHTKSVRFPGRFSKPLEYNGGTLFEAAFYPQDPALTFFDSGVPVADFRLLDGINSVGYWHPMTMRGLSMKGFRSCR